jgi:3-dehydroquinate synthase
MHTLTLKAPMTKNCLTTILLGSGTSTACSKFLKKQSRSVILFDASVLTIAQGIAATLHEPLFIPVDSGDASKSLKDVESITATMLNAGCDRNSTLICVGGGMLSDIGGFVASIFMRGISCILVPTTLLGMVDAAIGGKTALNVAGRKNMIGTISHPEAVVIDLDFLQTLPKKQLAEGLAEVIKIAAILDAPFFAWLEEHLNDVLARDMSAVETCVLKAVEAKVRTVEQDVLDRDVRLLLNFGHTVGHAVEGLSAYRLSHGEAISIGMMEEIRLSGFDGKKIKELLKKIGMPVSLPQEMSRVELWKIMLSDKKNEGNTVRAAVPLSIGTGTIIDIDKSHFLSELA